jgi:uncharacterized protein with GYD domain
VPLPEAARKAIREMIESGYARQVQMYEQSMERYEKQLTEYKAAKARRDKNIWQPKAGGRMINYYLTFGEFDFLTIIEAPSQTQMAAALLAAAGAGGVSDLRTTLAMTSVEAKGAFAAAADLVSTYRSPGGS